MLYHCTEETILTFSILPPLYLPFYNEWGANAYSTYSKFSYDPFTIRASSTSGSPVIVTGTCFFGFMNDTGGKFSYDGCNTLTITCPAGQVLYYNQDCNPFDEWLTYNQIILKNDTASKTEDFWNKIEYCTWVDQKNAAAIQGIEDVHAPLCEEYVYSYMKRVNKLKLPKGKLTIDDGWDIRYANDGKMLYGNWQINREKFPHMEKLVKDMQEEGFIPGLWFAPFTFTPNSELAQKHPELVGEPFGGSAESESVRKLMFIKPSPCLEEYYTKIFSYYIDMGFRKFKLDMSYGCKNEMIALLKCIYKVIKKQNPTVEVEAHIPDIFASRYCDTVRINDVCFDDADAWRAVTMEHYKVCRYSSSDKILNLDHLGTNTPVPKGELYLEHTKILLNLSGGYPCVSLLPDFFGGKICDEFVESVCAWYQQNNK